MTAVDYGLGARGLGQKLLTQCLPSSENSDPSPEPRAR